MSQYAVCSYLVGTTFTSSLSAIVNVNTTNLAASQTAPQYRAVAGSAIGSRTYVNLTTGTTQIAAIIALDPVGSTGGNSNLIKPNSVPTLDGDGLTFRFNTPPYIAGQTSTLPDMNLVKLHTHTHTQTRTHTQRLSTLSNSTTWHWLTHMPACVIVLCCCSGSLGHSTVKRRLVARMRPLPSCRPSQSYLTPPPLLRPALDRSVHSLSS